MRLYFSREEDVSSPYTLWVHRPDKAVERGRVWFSGSIVRCWERLPNGFPNIAVGQCVPMRVVPEEGKP